MMLTYIKYKTFYLKSIQNYLYTIFLALHYIPFMFFENWKGIELKNVGLK